MQAARLVGLEMQSWQKWPRHCHQEAASVITAAVTLKFLKDSSMGSYVTTLPAVFTQPATAHLLLRSACPPGSIDLSLRSALSFSPLWDYIIFFTSLCLTCHHPIHFPICLQNRPCRDPHFSTSTAPALVQALSSLIWMMLQPQAWSLSAFIFIPV